jgi:peptide/nickel transport system ATP-binding protein
MRHPYTEALLNSIPRVEQPSHTRLDAISGRLLDMARLPEGCRFAPRCRYAQAPCLESNPALARSKGSTHPHRCYFPAGTAAGERALLANLEVGRTVSGLDLRAAAVS